MVQEAGVDVDKLLDLLVRNASAELTTFQDHTIHRVMHNAQSQKDL
jgi:ferritin-like protein